MLVMAVTMLVLAGFLAALPACEAVQAAADNCQRSIQTEQRGNQKQAIPTTNHLGRSSSENLASDKRISYANIPRLSMSPDGLPVDQPNRSPRRLFQMLSKREAATILAALQFWREEMCPHGPTIMRPYFKAVGFGSRRR
jgi:hypothetical protein